MSTYSGYIGEAGEIRDPGLPTVDVESIIKDDDVQAAYEESSIEAAARCVVETTQNWNAIMKACTITEFCHLEATGEEFVYVEASASGFFQKIKDFFLAIWKKIQEIFKKAVIKFNQFTASDKAFVKKYEKDLVKMKNNGFSDDAEVSIYKDCLFYTKGVEEWKAGILATASVGAELNNVDTILTYFGITGTTDNAENSLSKKNVKITEDMISEKKDAVRANILKAIGGSKFTSNECSAKEFRKEMNTVFLGSEDKDSVGLAAALGLAMPFLTDSAKHKTALNTGLNASKRSIDAAIRTLTTLERTFNKTRSDVKANDPDGPDAGASHSIINKALDVMRASRTMLIDTNGFAIQALKTCSSQSRMVCVKVLSYKKPKHEAGVVQSESGMSLLDSLSMV